MRVMLVQVARLVTSQRHSPLLADSGISQYRRKAVSQAVEAQGVHGAARLVPVTDDALLNTRTLHQLAKFFAEWTHVALRLSCQRREKERILIVAAGQRKKVFLQRRMNYGDDFAAGFPRLEANGLDLGNQFDVAPAKA